MSQFAEVILPLAVQGTYTYRIPEAMSVGVGYRVLVPFGRKKYYTAVVVMTHDKEPQGYKVKEILALLDEGPILRHPQLKFWQWIAEYYLCTEGEVYKAAVPSGLKVESETQISPNPDNRHRSGHGHGRAGACLERRVRVLPRVQAKIRQAIYGRCRSSRKRGKIIRERGQKRRVSKRGI